MGVAMNRRIKFKLIAFMLIGLSIISCSLAKPITSSNSETEVTEVSSHATHTATIKEEQTMVSFTPAPTIIKTPILKTPIGYTTFPDGEYILYFIQGSLEAISLTNLSRTVLLDFDTNMIYLSEDKQQLVLVPDNYENPKLLNLETLMQEDLSFLKSCNEIFLINNNKSFLASCWTEQQNYELFLFSRNGKQFTQLTDCEAYFNCFSAQYTPDGKWISYQKGGNGAVQSSELGLYITPSSCIEISNECDKKAKGPFLFSVEYHWSPNSNYLASIWARGQIHLYELKDQKIIHLKDLQLPFKDSVEGFCWSPDSSQIAYTNGRSIWLVDITSGENKFLKNFDQYIYSFIGWVTIKDGKVLQNMP